jgi:hypothetical protein
MNLMLEYVVSLMTIAFFSLLDVDPMMRMIDWMIDFYGIYFENMKRFPRDYE